MDALRKFQLEAISRFVEDIFKAEPETGYALMIVRDGEGTKRQVDCVSNMEPAAYTEMLVEAAAQAMLHPHAVELDDTEDTPH